MDQPFRDRRDAGRKLAQLLLSLRRSEPLVLALPRGGVPVAFEVAGALGAPLDVFVVRKLGVPGHEELAMGAVASGGRIVLNREVIEKMGIKRAAIEDVARRELHEVLRRESMYRAEQPPNPISSRNVVLVDDGLATGATMRAAVTTLRMSEPARLVVAVPIAAPEACRALARIADEVVCASTPEDFRAVGLWYEDFAQVSDGEVQSLLELHRQRSSIQVTSAGVAHA
jgi:putative phosphoribosyl transferase